METKTPRKTPGASWQPAAITVVALFAFLWQVVIEDTAQPTVIGGIIALLGLPAAIQADRVRRAIGAARKELGREQDQKDQEDRD